MDQIVCPPDIWADFYLKSIRFLLLGADKAPAPALSQYRHLELTVRVLHDAAELEDILLMLTPVARNCTSLSVKFDNRSSKFEQIISSWINPDRLEKLEYFGITNQLRTFTTLQLKSLHLHHDVFGISEFIHPVSSLPLKPKKLILQSDLGLCILTTFPLPDPFQTTWNAGIEEIDLISPGQTWVNFIGGEPAENAPYDWFVGLHEKLNVPLGRFRFNGRLAVVHYVMQYSGIELEKIKILYRAGVPEDICFAERLGVLRDIVSSQMSQEIPESAAVELMSWAGMEASSHASHDSFSDRLMLLATAWEFGGPTGFAIQGKLLIDTILQTCPENAFANLAWAISQVDRYAVRRPEFYSNLFGRPELFANMSTDALRIVEQDELIVAKCSPVQHTRIWKVLSQSVAELAAAEKYDQAAHIISIALRMYRAEHLAGDAHCQQFLIHCNLLFASPEIKAKISSAFEINTDSLHRLVVSSQFAGLKALLGEENLVSHPVFLRLITEVPAILILRKSYLPLVAKEEFASALWNFIRFRVCLVEAPLLVAAKPSTAPGNRTSWQKIIDVVRNGAEDDRFLGAISHWTSKANLSVHAHRWTDAWVQAVMSSLVPIEHFSAFVKSYGNHYSPEEASEAISESVRPFLSSEQLIKMPDITARRMRMFYQTFFSPEDLFDVVHEVVTNTSKRDSSGKLTSPAVEAVDAVMLEFTAPIFFNDRSDPKLALLATLIVSSAPRDSLLSLCTAIKPLTLMDLEMFVVTGDPGFQEGSSHLKQGYGYLARRAIDHRDMVLLRVVIEDWQRDRPLPEMLRVLNTPAEVNYCVFESPVIFVRYFLLSVASSSNLLVDMFRMAWSPVPLPVAAQTHQPRVAQMRDRFLQVRGKDLIEIFSLPTQDWHWEALPAAWLSFIGLPLYVNMRQQYHESLAYYGNMETASSKLLIRVSSTLLSPFAHYLASSAGKQHPEQRLRSVALFKDLIRVHLDLLASRENWDGVLTNAMSLLKSVTSLKLDVPTDVLNAAAMCASVKLGNDTNGRKFAQRLEFGPQLLFSYLDAEGIWDRLVGRASNNSGGSVSSSSDSVSSSDAHGKKMGGKARKKLGKSGSISAPVSLASSSSSISASSDSIPKAESKSHSTVPSPTISPSEPKSVAKTGPLMESSPPPIKMPAKSPAEYSMSPTAQPALLPNRPRKSPDAALVYLSCPICFDSLPDHGLIPCGHMFCFDCSEGMRECPICRTPTTARIRMFFSQEESPKVD
jgi:hypothetical protein